MIGFYLLLFVIELTFLYFISRLSIKELFYILRIFFRSDKIVFIFIALIFFPGTVIHELSHFLVAIVLLLKVREIHIFPEFEKNYIKLGRVIYEKKDVLRGIIVGVAPIAIGLIIFFWISTLQIFFIENLWLKFIMFYLIFVISTTMFSSRQDLIDLVYLLPIAMISTILLYLFQIDLMGFLSKPQLIAVTADFVYDVNVYLGISIVVHTGLLIVLFTVKKIFKS